MIREITKDTELLQQKSLPFVSGDDDYLIADLFDTANAHKDNCVGLACIQIGVAKRVILVRQDDTFMLFRNPRIIKKSKNTYLADEACLSLEGTRRVKRHYSILVSWEDRNGKKKTQEFNGFVAQILQHEIDHCDGILI